MREHGPCQITPCLRAVLSSRVDDGPSTRIVCTKYPCPRPCWQKHWCAMRFANTRDGHVTSVAETETRPIRDV